MGLSTLRPDFLNGLLGVATGTPYPTSFQRRGAQVLDGCTLRLGWR